MCLYEAKWCQQLTHSSCKQTNSSNSIVIPLKQKTVTKLGSLQNMYLELELFDGPGRARREQYGVCAPDGQPETKQCCLYSLLIDFEQIKWDFVVAPKRFDAYSCKGECITRVSVSIECLEAGSRCTQHLIFALMH